MTIADTHRQAWADEYGEKPWPADPDAVYALARARAHEVRATGKFIRGVLRFIDMPRSSCT